MRDRALDTVLGAGVQRRFQEEGECDLSSGEQDRGAEEARPG